MTEKICDYCLRSQREIAESNDGIVNTATNAQGKTICYQCAEGAYNTMREGAAAVEKAVEEIKEAVLSDEDDNSGECQCPSCRLRRVLERNGYDVDAVTSAAMTKH